MIYHLRDKEGVLKVILPKKSAQGIFAEVDGCWKSYKSDTLISRAYHITKDTNWTIFQMNDNVIVTILLWQGDKIIEVDSDY